ncbi:MAG: 5-formyltetrahydrofolate cyclo-ligase [Gammaproteobacteria bacterium]|nr:5-formyltetrahydrofolate cyclo-ligase [Gammaproteobacteria bacterium]
MNSRAEIRRQMRHRRRGLPARERIGLARQLARRTSALTPIQHRQRIAVYLPNDGEMDLTPLIHRLWKNGKECFLPVLNRDRLWFMPYTGKTPLTPNRFGIPEPLLPAHRRCRPAALDLVLAPLVAFDGSGNRLGMGGGYYDRTFAFLTSRNHWKRPLIIGVAYEFQRMEHLSPHSLDVPLGGIITEKGLEWF